MSTRQPIAVIPARGGSQRIPGKNLRPMLGVPLISRAVGICLESGIFESVVVSTDSPDIRDLAEQAGAAVQDRPSDLADDHTPLLPVMAHAVSGLAPDTPVCCFYATAVTVRPANVAASWHRFQSLTASNPHATSFLTGIVGFPHPIQRALELHDSGELTMLSPEFAQTRTQDLPARWHDAGAFIWGTARAWAQSEPVLARAYGFPLDRAQVVDLDTEEDWEIAERLLSTQFIDPPD